MEKHIFFKGEKIFFNDVGEGKVVVLLHGFLGSKEIWKDVVAELMQKYRVITIDLPGHGKSGHFGYLHDVELMAECVKSILKSLRLKKCFLLGHSMGGYVALAFLELYPQNLLGLGLINSTAYADSIEKKNDRQRAIDLVKKSAQVYTSATIKNLFSESNLISKKKEIDFALQIALSTGKRGIIACLEGMKVRKDRRKILENSNLPVFFVIGQKDKILKSEDLMNQLKFIKNTHTLILENDGHLSFLENRPAFIKSLLDYIKESNKKRKKNLITGK